MNSDSDFEAEEAGARRRESSSLHSALKRARRYIRRAHTDRPRRSNASGLADELSSRFPFYSRSGPSTSRGGRKKRKIQQWKFVPVCLQSPLTDRVPTKGVLDSLCKIGLGSKWFSNDDKLAVNVDTSAEEFHFLLTCLFPPIRRVPYEICKATGPGNCLVIPLPITDESMRPQRGKPFHPAFSVDQLKERIGRKGKLYIRPVKQIPRERCPRLTDREVRKLDSTYYNCVLSVMIGSIVVM